MEYDYGYPDWMKDDGLLDAKYADVCNFSVIITCNCFLKGKVFYW